MAAVGGDYTLTIAGKQIVTMGDATVQVTGQIREMVEAMARDGKPRYTTRTRPGKLTVTIVNDGDQDATEIFDFDNVSGTLESANGVTYRLSNLTRIGEIPIIDQAAGTYPIEFIGDIREQ